MTYEEFRAVVLSLPGVEEGTSYGKPSFKAGGKFLTRVRREDASAVLSCVPYDEREMLMEVEPQTFHFTDHYKNYDYVLARIATLDAAQLRGFLLRRWRKIAPRALVKAFGEPEVSE
jgi:hypothetical protein